MTLTAAHLGHNRLLADAIARTTHEMVVAPSARTAGVAVFLVIGSEDLASLRSELHRLAVRCGAPLTARPSWALATVEHDNSALPWAVVARAGDGSAVGALLLVDRAQDPRTTVTTLAGTDGGHRAAILATDPAVAGLLGLALSAVRAQSRGSAPVVLGPLPADSAVVEAFAGSLAGAWWSPADVVPVIRPSVGEFLTAGTARTLRKSANRLAADGLSSAVHMTSDSARVLAMVPLLIEVHRERDHANGRVSELDDKVQHQIWRSRIELLADAGLLELATLRIDGVLAAYTFGVVDGSTYRLLEGRFVGEFARYAPGRLLEAAVVERALSTPGVTTFDWMTAVAPESLLGSNDADAMVTLHVGRR